MSVAADEKTEGFVERRQRQRRSREDILREIKLALTIGDGLLLDEEAEHARGFDPYDSHMGVKPRDPWKVQRRG
ncbi:MAG TPA: hypothetical protein VHX52_03080 [Steroidobacteraceae bacterium]|jgi:hypothetical protein|nr:hypothetical protein [Steroidobacteraceae bacterium]